MSWAPITWIFLHSFSFKVNEEYFNNNKSTCFQIVNYICQNLPCPMCQSHATKYLKDHSLYICKTKEDFKNYIWTFHNSVNYRLKKQIFDYKDLEMYKFSNFDKISYIFLIEFKKPYYYGRTMSSWQRKNVSNNLYQYFYNNWAHYS